MNHLHVTDRRWVTDTKLINITSNGQYKCCFCLVSRVLWDLPLVSCVLQLEPDKVKTIFLPKKVKTIFVLELLQ